MQIRLYHAPCIDLCISKQWYSYLDIICKPHWTLAQPDLRTLKVVWFFVGFFIYFFFNSSEMSAYSNCPNRKPSLPHDKVRKLWLVSGSRRTFPYNFSCKKKVTHFLFSLGSACYFHAMWKRIHLANRDSKEYKKSPFTLLSSGLHYLRQKLCFFTFQTNKEEFYTFAKTNLVREKKSLLCSATCNWSAQHAAWGYLSFSGS